MSRSDTDLPALGAVDVEGVSGLSSPASPALSWVEPRINFSWDEPWPFVTHSPSDGSWRFADPCPSEQLVLLRNAVVHDGEVFEVRPVPRGAFQGCGMSAVCISRNVTGLGENCFLGCRAFQFVAFEDGSHLREIGPSAFHCCDSLRSIAIPSFVGLLGRNCFALCASLGSATFERLSRLATIEDCAFIGCQSLNWLLIPAWVTAIGGSAFESRGLRSIGIEEGSESFRVVNEFLINFAGSSLIWVIGSPESIRIRASVEELRSFCCSRKERLRTVEFESDSSLRSIGRFAFAHCQLLASIRIPSSVEVLSEYCFLGCGGLRTVTFGSESRLRLIELGAFHQCRSLKSVSVPALVEVIGQRPVISVARR
jgi:hypothetical protein